MNRRAFLAWLGGTAAGVAAAPYLDLDKLLWIPGEKTIILPPAIVKPVNIFITPEWVTREVAMLWQNNLKLISVVNDACDYHRIQVRLPQRFAS